MLELRPWNFLFITHRVWIPKSCDILNLPFSKHFLRIKAIKWSADVFTPSSLNMKINVDDINKSELRIMWCLSDAQWLEIIFGKRISKQIESNTGFWRNKCMLARFSRRLQLPSFAEDYLVRAAESINPNWIC